MLKNRKKTTSFILSFIFVFSFAYITFGHAGDGRPIIANVEWKTGDVYANEPVNTLIHVFDLQAMEAQKNNRTLEPPVVQITLTNGKDQIQIDAERKSDDLFEANLIFPSSGKWDMTAHVLRPSANHIAEQHDHADASYFKSTLKVKYDFEKMVPLWLIWAGLLMMVAIILLYSVIIKKRKR
ncbi:MULTISPECIES: hypothetical protein [unclassified Paenibacillus]|uniref:hypothetical protein n=1 Tax=unclassified Paenibacillus TaxID=185978 RepID=UPI001AE5A278|nr:MULTISPECIES: hypothetical protein [unclassified Paenibacillus]MBP1156470.1 hypothetical protein [Paenibacillus sp. PvP091]MBP1168144.1 hypothetical protein [Paenibacillus sp. PvR098]MBP2439172.1 hypothetical protein [Paenibacillus sp. PvP052]